MRQTVQRLVITLLLRNGNTSTYRGANVAGVFDWRHAADRDDWTPPDPRRTRRAALISCSDVENEPPIGRRRPVGTALMLNRTR